VKFIRYIILLVLHTQLWFAAMPQAPRARFTHLTNLDGLSQSTVQAILKDRYGFMWFGTQDGLNRYDGYTFKIYRHQPHDSQSLRSSHILSLYEDRQGNLWVGTNNGALSMYDRKHDSFIHFKEMTAKGGTLSLKSVTTLYEDKQNNFWVGTYWKLNLLDRKTGKAIQFGSDPADPASLSDDGITSIYEDSKNNLWIGTINGLNLLDRKTKKFRRYLHDDNTHSSLSNNSVQAIAEDSRGRLWVGTKNGLNLFDASTGTFHHFTNDPADPTSLLNNQINSIADAGNGNLWLGTGNALEYFETDRQCFSHFQYNAHDESALKRNSAIMSMYYDKQGILWVGTYQGGVNKYDKHLTYFDLYKNNPNDPQSLSFNTITSFAENAEGDIWVSTVGGALNLWKRSLNQFIRFNPDPNNKNSLSNWGLLCLYQSKKTGYLWIGTYGSGIDRYDAVTNTFKHYTKGNEHDQLNNDAIYAVFEDSHGDVWMGTNGGGVNVLNPVTEEIKKYLPDVNKHGSVAGNYVRCFLEDTKGNIWAGTTTGLSKFNRSLNTFTTYDQGNTSLESDVIYSLCQDHKGNIWVGTLGGGLSLLDPQSGKTITYTTAQGLPDNTINSIIEDNKGMLWLSTNNGISQFNPEKNTYKNSSIHNGIQSFEFSQGAGLKTSRGELLFGGVNGFNIFHPGNLIENKNLPPVVITNFKLFNKPVVIGATKSPLQQDISQTKELILSYDQSIIAFEFAALGFTASEKNQYAYMLEGFDKKWNYVGSQRTATYTNLDAGEYILRVKAANNDGLWNEQETTLKLTITPPFWETWWFRSVIVILIAGSAIGFYKLRINAINAHKLLLERQVQERTESLAEKTLQEQHARYEAEHAGNELARKNIEMEQFVYIASHDLREPLRTTTGFIEMFQKQYKGKLDEKADNYLNFILRSTDRMKVLINDLLDYSRIGNDKKYEEVNCETLLRDVLADLSVAVTEAEATVTSDPLPVLHAYRTNLKQLFQNLITNAIKFRKKGIPPRIHITAIQKNGYWEFAFKDNGIGVEDKHKEKIFVIFQRLHNRTEYEGSGIGLAFCKKIVEMHQGNIWLESELGKGSIFYFTIQQNNRA
jgi:ligand-binding sensor domain-containing protein/signal transduction histidine kinase